MRTITISGNLGQDPVIRNTNSGQQVANFSVAVRHSRPDENGNYGTDWFRCTVWGNRASVVERFFHKGSHGVFSGDFEVSEYNGSTQLGVNVQDFDLPDNNASTTSQGSTNPAPQSNRNSGDSIDISDDDLPF